METEEKNNKKHAEHAHEVHPAPVVDVKPIEPEEVKSDVKPLPSVFEKTPPLTLALLGVLGGVILMIALGAILYYSGRLSFGSNRPFQGDATQPVNMVSQNFPQQQRRFRNWPSFNDDFQRMDDEFNQMQQAHDQMMNQFQNVQPTTGFSYQSNMNRGSGQMQNDQGTFSFFLNGQQYQIPYTVQNQQFSMKVGDLKNYLSANANAKVSLQLQDARGNVVKEFGTASDFNSDISYDLAKSGVSYLDLSVTDGTGNSLLQVHQQL